MELVGVETYSVCGLLYVLENQLISCSWAAWMPFSVWSLINRLFVQLMSSLPTDVSIYCHCPPLFLPILSFHKFSWLSEGSDLTLNGSTILDKIIGTTDLKLHRKSNFLLNNYQPFFTLCSRLISTRIYLFIPPKQVDSAENYTTLSWGDFNFYLHLRPV